MRQSATRANRMASIVSKVVLRSIKAGKINPEAIPQVMSDDNSSVVKVTANGGFANSAFDLALPQLIAKTKDHGIAVLAINDCAHLTALWVEVEAIADEGLAALAMCRSYATVAPTGGNKPLLGTNPLAFGWPRQSKSPYVFDFATSVAARGEIELHRRSGKKLPPAGQLMRREIKPLTRMPLCLAPCFRSADIRDRPSPQ